MKTIGRILMILAAFFIFSGLMVTAVNASGANVPDFGGARQFRPSDGGNNVRPEDGGNRPERGGEGRGGGPRWMFGLIKNVGVMALLVTVIAWPKSIAKKKKKQAGIKSANSGT